MQRGWAAQNAACTWPCVQTVFSRTEEVVQGPVNCQTSPRMVSVCHLRSRTATLQRPTAGQMLQELVSEPLTQRKRPRDAADIGSPSSASTPSGRPPVPKRPLVIRNP